jgi:hypothetical protein
VKSQKRKESRATGVDFRCIARAAKAKQELALSLRSVHCRPMAKTWVSKTSGKSQKAFVKAMRLLVAPKGRRGNSRPR